MSSHHFVKEGQEPALVILDWNEDLAIIAAQLMEWQPKLVVSKEALDLLLMDGFKPDAVLDFLGEFPNYLQPINSLEKSYFFETQNACNVLCSATEVKVFSILQNRNMTVYTEDFKYFVLHQALRKVLPQEKVMWIYIEDENSKIKLASSDNQAIDLSDFIGNICIEEL